MIEQGSLPSGNPLFPIFGIGPVENEVLQPPYQNTPANLKDTGAVDANVYGIYMNDFRKFSPVNVPMSALLMYLLYRQSRRLHCIWRYRHCEVPEPAPKRGLAPDQRQRSRVTICD